MKAADQVGKIKWSIRKEVNDQSREKTVLNQVETIVQHPILKTNISNIYREIMQESKTAQQFFRHLSIPFRHIGIIGLGLMGGSICKGIKTKDPSIEIGTLIHESEDTSLAQHGCWIDHVHPSIGELMQNSELIILASPISTIIPIAEELKRNTNYAEKLIVIDIAGVKEAIVDSFERLSSKNLEFISTHPMAGKETSGFGNSHPTLFVDRPWVIVPHRENSSDGLNNVRDFIQFLGAKPICLDATIHDRQAALISHLPSILAKSYFDFVCSTDVESLMIAGPGFQSYTRLAHDNQTMRNEFETYNHNAIQESLNRWLEYLEINRSKE